MPAGLVGSSLKRQKPGHVPEHLGWHRILSQQIHPTQKIGKAEDRKREKVRIRGGEDLRQEAFDLPQEPPLGKGIVGFQRLKYLRTAQGPHVVKPLPKKRHVDPVAVHDALVLTPQSSTCSGVSRNRFFAREEPARWV